MPFESMLTISAVVLIVSGGAKLVDPAPTAGALRAARLPSGRGWVWALAVGEVILGTTALTVPDPWAPAGVALAYLAFAGFVAHALRADIPIQSCGCFGRSDTPPTGLHLVVNLVLATGSMAAAFTGAPLLDRIMAAPPAGLLEAGFAAIGAYLVYLLLAELPATLSAARGAES